METWYRLEPTHVSARDALDASEARLDDPKVTDATIMWWLVARDTLIRSRSTRTPIDEAALAAANVPLLSRRSGGGPVLWGPDLLALDVIVPRSHPLHTDDVVDGYRWVGETLALALRSVGIDVSALAPADARAQNVRHLAQLACFAGRSPWEVVAGSAKAVGLSMIRRTTGTLVQAGIVTGPGGARLVEFLDAPADVRDEVAEALRPPPGPLPSPAAIVAAVDATIAARRDARFRAIAIEFGDTRAHLRPVEAAS